MTCEHTPKYPELAAVPSIQSALACCTIVDSHADLARHPRAVTIPEGQRTMLERSFWEGCSDLQRACVIAHERAHVVIGLDCPCEGCADKVGGYLMRVWGYSVDSIQEGFRSLLHWVRDAPGGAKEGAHMAVRGLAARGLLGDVTPTRATLLTRTRAGTAVAPTPTSTKSVLETGASILGSRVTAPSFISATKAAPTQTRLPAPLPTDTRKIVITDPKVVSPATPGGGHDSPGTDGFAPGTNVPPSPADAVATQIKVQVVAGVIVALIIALVIGAR